MHDHGDWQIRTCAVPHAQPYLECFGLAVEAGGSKFTFSGGAGSCAALRDLARGADVLLLWCYRLDSDAASAEMIALSPSPQQIVDMAAAQTFKRVILTHFRQHMDTYFKPEQVQTTLEWCVAKDLAVFNI